MSRKRYLLVLLSTNPGGSEFNLSSEGAKRTVMDILEFIDMNVPAPMLKSGVLGLNKVRWAILPPPTLFMVQNHLDVFLSSIPDQPTMTGLGRSSETNSLLHQLPLFYLQTV